MATFLGLQCYQCNTMQAKQQRKSSNKWTCALCNEKQSVRKVFTRSGVAKDIRIFVQDFNMCVHRRMPQEEEEAEAETAAGEEKSFAYGSEWSEYLEENVMLSLSPIADYDMPIVTALPDPPFGKRKGQVIGASKELNLSHSSTANKKRTQHVSRPSGDEIANIIGRLKNSGSPAPEGGERSRSRTTQDCGKQVSKWSSYLESQNDALVSTVGGNHNNGSTFEWQDQVIDEHVHPDFL